jgi:hypothetical protein
MASQFNRRKFLLRMAQLAMASSLPTQFFYEQVKASASARKRRHFVHFIGYGGWESSWFHSTFSGQHLMGRSDAHVSFGAGGFEYEKRDIALKYTSKCSSPEERELSRHPLGARLGPAMAAAMGGSDWNQTLIWKGIAHAAGHEGNNRMLIHGSVSSYAVSMSGIIAATLAQVDRRPLHYVLMATDPVKLFTNFAMAEDAAIPVCLDGVSDFASMTSLHAKDVTSQEIRAEIAQSVQKLSVEVLAKRAKLASSQTVARAFAASVEGANAIYGSGMAQDPEILYLRKYYFLEGLKAVKRLYEGNEDIKRRASIVIGASGWKYDATFESLLRVLPSYAGLPDYREFRADPNRYLASLRDIEENPSFVSKGEHFYGNSTAIAHSAIGWLDRLRTQAGYYAFADFLIRRNLSAVVDVPAWPGMVDAHGGSAGDYLSELLSHHLTFAQFFAFQRSLQSVSLPEGGTLLDATLMVCHTEFDRKIHHEAKQSPGEADGPIGTDHGGTASVLMAGYGVQGGRIVGGVHEGLHSGSPTAPFLNGVFSGPLPIDPASGLPSPSGQVPNILSLAPSMVAAFGATLPAQQVTDFKAIPALLRGEKG